LRALGLRCAYLIVIWIEECPSNSLTSIKLAPRIMRWDAYVCRNMCQPTRRRPALRQTFISGKSSFRSFDFDSQCHLWSIELSSLQNTNGPRRC
jgi:hypothetical protein